MNIKVFTIPASSPKDFIEAVDKIREALKFGNPERAALQREIVSKGKISVVYRSETYIPPFNNPDRLTLFLVDGKKDVYGEIPVANDVTAQQICSIAGVINPNTKGVCYECFAVAFQNEQGTFQFFFSSSGSTFVVCEINDILSVHTFSVTFGNTPSNKTCWDLAANGKEESEFSDEDIAILTNWVESLVSGVE
jgi:hypothetical protein